MLIHPRLKTPGKLSRAPEARIEEATRLAAAIDLKVVHPRAVSAPRLRPATLFGKGVVDELAEVVAQSIRDDKEIDLAIVDAQLTPVQQRNLETAWKVKVIDRTGLILEIFGERARTREGVLQVELASLTYQRSRLVRSWTHLERQRGGAGFMGGPGERQIETDRRLISERINRLSKDLEEVKRTRELHRSARRRVPYPIVALVGYTNAGKSTLFNYLTESKVFAEDQLFATLDPTMRALDLPSGRRVILSDTVGFISDLPHELVNAFHATLEEVREADLILHVRDISHPETEEQKEDVVEVMEDMGLGSETQENATIEVLNKIDLMDPDDKEILTNRAKRDGPAALPASAKTGEGTEAILAVIDDFLSRDMATSEVSLAYHEGAALAWLYEHGEVLERSDEENAVRLTVRMAPKNAARFERLRKS